MTPTLRPDLKDIPIRMMDLPVDPDRGYPVPWFVDWIDGKPEFRLMSGQKWKRAVKERLCWVCGKRLGAHLCFVLGPMCGITRVTSEPPCHLSCARWSARFCPFLARPRMVRRDDAELLAKGAEKTIGGISLQRNPGAALLWTARDYEVFRPRGGGVLIKVGEATDWEWWYAGRRATRGEVEESIRTGLPALEATTAKELTEANATTALAELRQRAKDFERYLP
jgi:hypothetical protein